MKFSAIATGLLLSLVPSLFADDHPTGDKLKAYLDGKKYVTEMGFFMRVDFTAGKFEIAHVQAIEDRGDYSVRGDKIILLSEGTDAQGKRNSKSCQIVWNSNSVAYTEELDCGKGRRFFLETSKRPEGSEIRIGDETAVVIDSKRASLTTKVVFRKKPTKKGTPLRCADSSSPLVLGFEFTVYARTKEKMKVDKWENYWYYVYNDYLPEVHYDQKNNQPVSCEAPAGWVFGEFVKFN